MGNTTGVNRVFLVGRIASTPKKHFAGNGDYQVHFTLSTKETVGKGSHQSEHTELHNVLVNSHYPDLQNIQLCKGAMLHIAGRIKTRPVTDANGTKQYKTEVEVQQITLLQLPVEIAD